MIKQTYMHESPSKHDLKPKELVARKLSRNIKSASTNNKAANKTL